MSLTSYAAKLCIGAYQLYVIGSYSTLLEREKADLCSTNIYWTHWPPTLAHFEWAVTGMYPLGQLHVASRQRAPPWHWWSWLQPASPIAPGGHRHGTLDLYQQGGALHLYGTKGHYTYTARRDIRPTLDRASSLHRDGHRSVNILVAPEQILKPLWKALPWPYIRTKYC